MSIETLSSLELSVRTLIHDAQTALSTARSEVYGASQRFSNMHNIPDDMLSTEIEMRLEPLCCVVERLREVDRLILCADERIGQYIR